MGSISKGAETSRSEKETLPYTSPGSDLEPPQRKMAACPLEIELWRFVTHNTFCFVYTRLGKRFSLDEQIEAIFRSSYKLPDSRKPPSK